MLFFYGGGEVERENCIFIALDSISFPSKALAPGKNFARTTKFNYWQIY